MKRTVLALITLAWMAAAVCAQRYHDPIYLVGAWPWPTTTTPNLYLKGIMKLDNTGPAPVLSTLAVPGYMPGSVLMDVDNRNVVFGVRGTSSLTTLMNSMRSGLFRYDPTTMQVSTLYAYTSGTLAYHGFHHAVIDYHGDFVTAVYNYDSARGLAQYELWKVDRSGTCSTLLTSLQAGLTHPWELHGHLRYNMDNGLLLVCDLYRVWTPSYQTLYKIYEVDTDLGIVNTWSAPPANAGWAGWNCMPQNHRTGAIEGAYNSNIFRIQQGTGPHTTLATLNMLGTLGAYTSGDYDLQTADLPRQVYAGYNYSNPALTYLYYVDASTWAVTSFSVAPFRNYNYAGLAFYQGRHTQTVKTGRYRWQIRLSAPRFPGKAYAVAAGISGVRPGIPLLDARHINLNVDAVTLLTLGNQVPAIWNGGPGTLDANGEAQGVLDLSLVGGLGVPLWIAWMVFDPAAPLGIAYIPDTYVMRV